MLRGLLRMLWGLLRGMLRGGLPMGSPLKREAPGFSPGEDVTPATCTYAFCGEPPAAGRPLVDARTPGGRREFFCAEHRGRAVKLGWEEVSA